MSEIDDIDALASEYVLGTLDAGERASVSARRLREPRLEAAIQAWEQRFAPLLDTVASVAPPATLQAKLNARLDTAVAPSLASLSVGSPLAASNVVGLEKRLRRWRAIAVSASAVAASLAITLGVREALRPDVANNYVAVFQKDDASPAFLLSIDLQTRNLSIQRVSADVPTGKTYQLWIASDKIGPAPRSLGLIEAGDAAVKKALTSFDPNLVQQATFGVSLEPAGGSPTGKPTGPVLHAKLIPSAP
jgi:anti-sigma-K factor RskA